MKNASSHQALRKAELVLRRLERLVLRFQKASPATVALRKEVDGQAVHSKAMIRGIATQTRVTRLLGMLHAQGKVEWFFESKKGDSFDHKGIDQLGKIVGKYGGHYFFVDSKSSYNFINDRQHRISRIFVPEQYRSDEEEAERLFGEIRKPYSINPYARKEGIASRRSKHCRRNVSLDLEVSNLPAKKKEGV